MLQILANLAEKNNLFSEGGKYMIGYIRFRKESRYLLKNNLIRVGVIILLNTVLTLLLKPSGGDLLLFCIPIFLVALASTITTGLGLGIGAAIIFYQDQSLSLMYLVYILAAILVTFPLTGIYHCASHVSMRPRWLNRFIGEIIGLWHMSSIDEWSIIHAMHHAYSDDPQKDPHPPAGLIFSQFLKTTAQKIFATLKQQFINIHGEENLKDLNNALKIGLLRQMLLSYFWFVLLGAKLYIFLFATNIVFKKLHYAWFNWATHVRAGDDVDILDLNSGYYRIINAFSFNLYLHRAHHKRPGDFIPRVQQ